MSVDLPKKKVLPIIYFEEGAGNPESPNDFTLKKVFEGNISMLPIEKRKNYISYSELLTWYECKFKHKLKYIEQISLDGPNENTEYGQALHDMLETYLKTKTLPVYNEQKQLLTEMFNKLPKAAELNSQQDQWHDTIEPIMEQVPEFMTKTFGDWEFISAEYEMFEPIEKEDGYFFKGYVDGIIKANNKVTIIDWKTSANFWDKSKIKDPKKYMQLVLYKHFYSIKNNIPLDDISCGFVILRRKVTKTSKERCMFIPIEVSSKELEEAEKLIHQFFLSIKKHYYSKNRDSCRFCVYYNTTHCKG